MPALPRAALLLLPVLLAPWAAACAPEADVVVYCALDQVHAEPLLKRFEDETGLRVRAEFDVEAHKTVGLVERIRAESGRPRCDVFWNNEIAHTVEMAGEGLLAAYDSPSAADIPETFRDPERRWTGFAARARVLIVNTELVPDPSVVRGMQDLVDPLWAGRAGIAAPLTGTTLTHVTALYDVIGEEATRAWLRAIVDGDVAVTRGNAHVMKLVSTGELAWGFTDTDDLNVALGNGQPVVAVYPDQKAALGEDAIGTLVIPNTVAVLAAAPHPDAARRLVDFVLSREVERELAWSRSAQIPVRADVDRPAHVRSAAELDVMAVDWAHVGATVRQRLAEHTELFLE